MTLFRILPQPAHAPIISEYDDSDEEQMDELLVSALTIKASLPTYGNRGGWQPMNHVDFGDGGAYPECHVAQYPLEMGRKKVRGHMGWNIRGGF
jgi:SNW domain-containing protein 1